MARGESNGAPLRLLVGHPLWLQRLDDLERRLPAPRARALVVLAKRAGLVGHRASEPPCKYRNTTRAHCQSGALKRLSSDPNNAKVYVKQQQQADDDGGGGGGGKSDHNKRY